MKKILLSILAISMPWVVLLIKDNPGGAVVALIMQATVIGWPFASYWAWRTVNPVAPTHQSKQ
ncbi:hypothetical protein EP47_07860 [Legionella norrlandica]|uniref:YqaE/Pmp3 family membrane protein n=1 Tax=Legionella norrlandica TaxID=1498499 RepID=A0A0A2SWE4_9GAMM|nr:hypothetical protein EP47_07860 [Legionella norrlandica]